MALFHFSREGDQVIDKPHVSVKVGTGCSAGCDCQFSYKNLKTSITYNHEAIKKNIDLVEEKFSNDFEIFLVGLNVLKYNEIYKVLDYIQSKSRIFKLQVPHNLDVDNIETLKNISKKYGSYDVSIPKTVDNMKELFDLVKEIHFLNNLGFNGKIYFDIFLDIKKYETIIDSIIKKLSTRESFNKYNCIIGVKFDVKFHDLSWKLNHSTSSVDFLKRKTCMMRDYFKVYQDRVYLEDHIEVGVGGDLIFHDNLCYLGNYAMSNIKKEKELIIQDFLKYQQYLKRIEGNDLVKQCYKCIKNTYHYSKKLDYYQY